MKQKTITQSLSWLHTWFGLVVGWVLFAIFFTGTLAVFDSEIDRWMHPELPVNTLSQAQSAEHALSYLREHHRDADIWNIGLPTERFNALTVSAGEQRKGAGKVLDAQTGELVDTRETAGGRFFFRFHFTLNMPRNIGIWLVGFAGMIMLVALISGIVIHKKIFKDFFTFRPNKGQRSWLDAHNASGVLLLPFHLMITYTGLVIFYLIYMPAAMDALFDGDREALMRAQRAGPVMERAASPERGGRGANHGVKEVSEPAQMIDLATVIAQAEEKMGPIGGLTITHPDRSNARIDARPVLGNRIELTKGKSMQFDGVTGAIVREPPESRASQYTQRVMAGLHFAQFGGYPMRWLYFLCGLISSGMIATGLLMFTVKRQRRHNADGVLGSWLYHVAERLNISVVAGLAVASAAFLWANRLLPVALSHRAAWEVRVFFIVWLVTLLHAVIRPRRAAWREQTAAAAALCLLLPLANLWVMPVQSNWIFEAAVVGLGVLLAWGAWRTTQQPQKTERKRARKVTAEAV